MGSKKIIWGEANDIARRIAYKAFEHLTTPLKREEDKIALDAYRKVFNLLGVSKKLLLESGFATTTSNIHIDVRNAHGQELELRSTSSDEEYLCPNGGYSMVLIDDDLFQHATKLKQRQNPLNEKRSDLQNVLRDELIGKTATFAMKSWPEAADIISAVLNLGKPTMTVPLEVLLAKFLPMLPSPKE